MYSFLVSSYIVLSVFQDTFFRSMGVIFSSPAIFLTPFLFLYRFRSFYPKKSYSLIFIFFYLLYFLIQTLVFNHYINDLVLYGIKLFIVFLFPVFIYKIFDGVDLRNFQKHVIISIILMFIGVLGTEYFPQLLINDYLHYSFDPQTYNGRNPGFSYESSTLIFSIVVYSLFFLANSRPFIIMFLLGLGIILSFYFSFSKGAFLALFLSIVIYFFIRKPFYLIILLSSVSYSVIFFLNDLIALYQETVDLSTTLSTRFSYFLSIISIVIDFPLGLSPFLALEMLVEKLNHFAIISSEFGSSSEIYAHIKDISGLSPKSTLTSGVLYFGFPFLIFWVAYHFMLLKNLRDSSFDFILTSFLFISLSTYINIDTLYFIPPFYVYLQLKSREKNERMQ